MNREKSTLLCTVIAALMTLMVLVAAPAVAGEGRHHHGYYHGWWWVPAAAWPLYAYPYAYRTSPVVVVESGVPTESMVAAQPVQYWYYCDPARGYYPYVPTCPTAWRPVPATPPQ